MNCSLYYQNVRGIRTKSNQFFENVLTNEYDVICLTETWLNRNFNSAEYFPREYDVFRADRDYDTLSVKYGGGVLIALRKVFQARRRRDLEVYAESVWVEVSTTDQIKLLIGTFYYPPRYSSVLFNEQMTELGDMLNNQNCRLMIAGDFNIPEIRWKSPDTPLQSGDTKGESLLQFMHLLNLTQRNSIENPAGNILDLVLSNFPFSECLASADSLVPPDTWHVSFYFTFIIHRPQRNYLECEKFLFSKGDYLGLFLYLRDHDWSRVLNISDANEAFYALTSVVHEAMRLFVPKHKCFRSSYPPWFSHELKHLLRQKLRYHRKYKVMRSEYWRQKFREARFQVKVAYKRDKKVHLQSVESNLNREPKLFWRYLKDISTPRTSITLAQDGTVIDKPKDVADCFADYFYSVLSANTFPSNSHCTFSPLNDSGNVLHTFSFSERDIERAISALKPKFSLAFDGIPSFIVKGCSTIFVPLLTHIFNVSLSNGIFPELLKNGVIVPVHKSGDSCEVTKYRPITLQSPFAKVFEIALFHHLWFFFKRQIGNAQHGFYKGRSVETNLMTFLEYTSHYIENRGQVDAVYFDLSKAFDLVDHQRLVEKLAAYGVCNQLCTFIMDYLSGRRNYVRVNGVLSKPFISTSGVPQGSILGPLLFNVFINDITCCVENSRILLYADDIKLFREISTHDDCVLLQSDILNIVNWCAENKLLINVTKTFVLTFTRKSLAVLHDYTLNGILLKRVKESRDLGIVVDSELHFRSHVDSVVNKAYSLLGIVSRITRPFSNPLCFVRLFLTMVIPKLHFVSVVWNRLGITSTAKLENVQRRFIRIVYDRHFDRRVYYQYENMLEKLQLAKLSKKRLDADLLFLFKSLHSIIDCEDLTSSIEIRVPCKSFREFLLFRISSTCSPMQRLFRLYNEKASHLDIFNNNLHLFKLTLTELH